MKLSLFLTFLFLFTSVQLDAWAKKKKVKKHSPGACAVNVLEDLTGNPVSLEAISPALRNNPHHPDVVAERSQQARDYYGPREKKGDRKRRKGSAGKPKPDPSFNRSETMNPLSDIPVYVGERIKRLKCYKDRECHGDLIFFTPGFQALAERSLRGEKIFEDIMGIFERPGMKDLKPEILNMIRGCIKVKSLCNENQFEAIVKLQTTDFSPTPSPHFFTQTLEAIGRAGPDVDPERFLTFLKDSKRSGGGEIHGTGSGVTTDGKQLYIDNNPVPSSEVVYYTSLHREDKAVNLLSRLGHKVEILHEKKDVRIAEGMQRRFEEITKTDQIGTGMNPDLILNDNFIYDIYSPLKTLSQGDTDKVVEGILFKSEGRNFKKTIGLDQVDLKNYGKRQTNRVVIYADSYDGNVSEIAAEIRKKISEHKPEHLEEAVILFERNGNPKMLNVWP